MTQQSNAPFLVYDKAFHGLVETTGDALLILEGALQSVIPRVTRRLTDDERELFVRNGSVFVFCVGESSIKRWTDGRTWSPSRILGNFLIYRETYEPKTKLLRNKANAPLLQASALDISSQRENEEMKLLRDQSREGKLRSKRTRALVGSLNDAQQGHKFKENGLIKKTFSMTLNGEAYHIISYYNLNDAVRGHLITPRQDPRLRDLVIRPELLEKSHFRMAPRVDIRGGIPHYAGTKNELDDPTQRATITSSSTSHFYTPPPLNDVYYPSFSEPSRIPSYEPSGNPSTPSDNWMRSTPPLFHHAMPPRFRAVPRYAPYDRQLDRPGPDYSTALRPSFSSGTSVTPTDTNFGLDMSMNSPLFPYDGTLPPISTLTRPDTSTFAFHSSVTEMPGTLTKDCGDIHRVLV